MSWVSPLSYCSHGVLCAGEKEHNVPETKTQEPKAQRHRSDSHRALQPLAAFQNLLLSSP